jgi:hypothetical protein
MFRIALDLIVAIAALRIGVSDQTLANISI